MDENTTGAVANDGEQTTQPAAQTLTLEQVQAAIKDAQDKTAKEWQSRFDKILTEKKQEQEKKLTVEEQLASIQAERQAERLEWVRKEAKASAGLDNDLEQALLGYASSDADTIKMSAEKIKEWWGNKELTYQKKIAELEQKLQYGAKPPIKGGALGSDFGKMSIDQVNEYASQSEAHLAEVLAWRRTNRR
jgi:hypothetical protein